VVERLTAIAFAIVMHLSGSVLAAAEEGAPSELERQGMALAERMCSACHAIGKTGASPRAPAPAFRDLGNRVDLDDFAHQLREGLTSGHPDMPTFRFTREDARALTAYLRSIQAR
jgi:cytochrome c